MSGRLQVVGCIYAYAARMAERVGFKAIYLSGGGVAAARSECRIWVSRLSRTC